MTSFNAILKGIEAAGAQKDAVAGATAILGWGERILENWNDARGEKPTKLKREGFRLLALHRQGAKGDPSFNACRETCRELVYHYNLILAEPNHDETAQRLRMAKMVVKHLCLFVQGKIEEGALGDFCCSSRPVRTEIETKVKETPKYA